MQPNLKKVLINQLMMVASGTVKTNGTYTGLIRIILPMETIW